MNSILTAVNAVLPLAALMFIGALVKRKNIIHDAAFREFNWIVFHVCLPVTLFNNIRGMDPALLTDPGILVFALCGVFAVIVLSVLGIGRLDLDDRQKGVMTQAIFRSNFVILGLPIVESIYGTGNAGPVPLLVAFVVPVYNVVSVLVLEKYSGRKGNLAKTLKNLLTNPLIIGALCGLVFQVCHLRTPQVLSSILEQINRMTTPLSLLVLGGSFELMSVSANRKQLTIVVLNKLIIVPLVVITAAVLLGYRGVDLASLLALFGGPTAVASFSMAMQMGLDSELAAECVMCTTIGVIFTLFGFISVLGGMGLL